MSYLGHCNDGSSIQKHSVGPLYPCVVYEQGPADRTELRVMAHDTLVAVPSRETAATLVAFTRVLHQRGVGSWGVCMRNAAALLHLKVIKS